MIKMSFHFLCVIYKTTLSLSLSKGQNFETTKPRGGFFFFPLKEYTQSSIMLIFYLDEKEKDPVENSGTLKEREKTGVRERKGLRRSTEQHRQTQRKTRHKNAQMTIQAK